jgi:DNA-binding MarR family transcriptional regulator
MHISFLAGSLGIRGVTTEEGRRRPVMGEELCDLERELILLMRHHLANARKQNPKLLERSAYLLLSRLQTEGPMSIGQLADALGLDASTVNRQTAAVLQHGLAERIPDPDGGIARKFSVTREGAERVAADREWGRQSMGRAVEDWPEDDVRDLVRLLTRFNVSVEKMDGRPWPREQVSSEASG